MFKIYEQIAVLSTITLISALISTVSIIPFINKLGLKYGIIDKPNKRKIHKGNVVRLGGIGIFIGFLIGIIVVNLFLNNNESYKIIYEQKFTLIFGVSGFLLLGLIDDVKTLSPFYKTCRSNNANLTFFLQMV